MTRLSPAMNFVLNLLGRTGEALFAVGSWMIFIGVTGLLVFVPYMGARTLLVWTQMHLPTWLHAIMLVVAFCLLLLGTWSITGDRGSRLFATLERLGIRLPILSSVALLLFAIVCFAALSSWLNDFGLIEFEPPLARADVYRVQDFYLWHFLDSIPGLRVPETLLWNEPMRHQGALAGTLLLIFKIFVIIPVIGSFAAWYKARKARALARSSSAGPRNPTIQPTGSAGG